MDGTPDKPTEKADPSAVRFHKGTPPANSDRKGVDATGGFNDTSSTYILADLLRWKPGQLKQLLSDLDLTSSGCLEKRDVAEKITRHPQGLATAAAVAAARGDPMPELVQPASPHDGSGSGGARMMRTREDIETRKSRNLCMPASKVAKSTEGRDPRQQQDEGDFFDGSDGRTERGAVPVLHERLDEGHAGGSEDIDADENENLAGMTLADYMSQTPAAENTRRPAATGNYRESRRPPANSGDGGGSASRPASSLSASGVRRNVPLAPAHVTPPSIPAPNWVPKTKVCWSLNAKNR